MLAEIEGERITRAEFESKNAADLFGARNTYYEAEKEVLDEFIDELLVERQAHKENLTVQELFDKHVMAALPPDPSEEALRLYYEGLSSAGPFEAVRDQILEHVRQRRIDKAKEEYLKKLREQANINLLLSPPRAQVSLENAPVRGPQDAPVVVVEFADYECPYCQKIQPELERLKREYAGKLAFAYKDLPLPNHPNARKAAEAAHCAGAQGKFWDFHDRLVQSGRLQIPELAQHARDLSLDMERFETCLNTGEQASVIDAHMEEAKKLGLRGTPSFLVNGRLLSGAVSYEELKRVVDEELGRAAGAAHEQVAGR